MHKIAIIGIIGLAGTVLTLPADEVGLLERIDSSSKRAMEAINAGAAGKPIKDDPTLESQYNGKAFGGGGNFTEGKKSGQMATFLYDENVTAGKYKTTRSFFGIKNPWIGREVPDMKAAPLMARGILPIDKTFVSDEVETRAVPGSDRDAFSDKADVPTREYPGKGKAQGAVTHFGGQLTKEMSIEEIREILNKNR